MTGKIICDHDPSCSIPGQYWHKVYYTEVFDSEAKLLEIIAPDTEPDFLCCTECGEVARYEQSKELKAIRHDKTVEIKEQMVLL